MLKGRSLTELAQEIDRQANQKADYLAPSHQVQLVPVHDTHTNTDPPAVYARVADNDTTPAFLGPITDLGHAQISERLQIPKRYYDRMLQEAPHLLMQNANEWFARGDDQRLVRTLDGSMRALLSNRYQRIDNYEVLTAILPVLHDFPGLRVESAEVTEKRMYVKAVTDRVQGEVSKGDVMQAGVLITNSEVGLGAFTVAPLILRLVCMNGMVVNAAAKRKTHVGTALEASTDAPGLEYGEDTVRAIDASIVLRARDHVKWALSDAFLQPQIEKMQKAAGVELKNPIKTVEVLQKQAFVSNTEGESILQHLLRGGDMNLYGFANAITRAAQDTDDYDRSTELEALGHKIVTLTPSEYRVYANAAD